MPRGSRLALWSIGLLVCLSLYIKGRVPAGKGEGAAFFHAEPGKVTVRLAGDFPRQGLYQFPVGTSPAAAIKMTMPDAAVGATLKGVAGAALQSGDVVTLELRNREKPVISLGKMAARERMLVGIPLEPDRLTEEEWASLPGIGPVLSSRIVADRQRNGDFGTVEALQRVPGIGAKKLSAIRQFFPPP